ncbi:MAG: hypothetical protein JOY92_11435 [Verrucomicrobia bacterium]|nr:hypothetical protein [Verrucomicrobiota bacterium]
MRLSPVFALCFWLGTAGLGLCQEIYVQSAFYGRGGYGIDVTRQVQQLAEQRGEIYVSNSTFGADPAPGRTKFLTITYTVDGRQITRRVEENQVFRFQVPEGPPPPPYAGREIPPGPYPPGPGQGVFRGRVIGGVPDYRDEGEAYGPRIVRAVYGAHGRYVDVTETVRRLVSDGVRFEVSNETFGVDPYKGRSKKLKITFQEDGGTSEKEYDEGDHVRLR